MIIGITAGSFTTGAGGILLQVFGFLFVIVFFAGSIASFLASFFLAKKSNSIEDQGGKTPKNVEEEAKVEAKQRLPHSPEKVIEEYISAKINLDGWKTDLKIWEKRPNSSRKANKIYSLKMEISSLEDSIKKMEDIEENAKKAPLKNRAQIVQLNYEIIHLKKRMQTYQHRDDARGRNVKETVTESINEKEHTLARLMKE